MKEKLAAKGNPFLGSKTALSFAPSDRYVVQLIEVYPGVERSLLLETIKHVLALHDLLRLYAVKEQSTIKLSIDDEYLAESIKWVHLENLSEEEQKRLITSTAIEIYRSIDDYDGYLSRFIYFDFGEANAGLFLIVLHHILADDYSLNILVRDIQSIYEQIQHTKTVHLPQKSASFNQFVLRIKKYLHSDFPGELQYWNSLQSTIKVLPTDNSQENLGLSSASFHPTMIQRITLSLDERVTEQLLRSVAKLRISFEDVLLAGLLQAARFWQEVPGLHVYIINNGRLLFSDIDVASTIGYISTGLWNYFELPRTSSPQELLRSTMEQRNKVPHRGMGLSLAMNYNGYNDPTWMQFYASEKMSVIKDIYYFDNIIFNYHGRINFQGSSKQGQFKQAALTYQSLVQPYALFQSHQESQEFHRLNVRAGIQHNQLILMWEFNEFIYKPNTVEILANTHLQAIQSIGAYCASSI